MIHLFVTRVSLTLLACVLLLGLAFPAIGEAASPRAGMWAKVEKAISDGLPKTAIENLMPIVEAALKDKAYGEAAKAMCRKIVLEANIQGNKAEEKVTRLQETLETAPNELKPLLRAVLARWYWHYFRQNNWRFMNRTATAKLDDKDFTTWDLPKLFGHIGGLFDAAIADKEPLQALSIEEFKDFLQPGNMPASYRPTLYDFLVYQALEFYTSGEQAGARPQDAFVVEADSPALADASAFMAWNPPTTDTESSKYKAIRLLQALLKFHASDKDRGAFLDADIFRLRWLKSAAVGENAAEACFKQLQVIAQEFKDHELSSTALEAMAQIRYAENNRKEAHQLASEGARRFPSSAGGQNCRALISQIEQKTLAITTERVAGKPLPNIKVDYTNIDVVHFRLVKADWKQMLNDERWSTPEDVRWDKWERLLTRAAVKEWKVSLPATPDYLSRTEFTPFPEVKKGYYYLIGSWKDTFTQSDNSIFVTTVFVSDLSMITRNRWGNCEVMVVDAETGLPARKAEVRVYRQDNEGWWKDRGTVKANTDGWYQIKGENGFLLSAALDDDFIAMPHTLSTWQPYEPDASTQVFFFTDRAIYRPGQMIQFKGLLVRVDQQQNRYEVRPNQNVDVTFYDVNRQQITRQTFTTNEAGSFSGTFTAPTDRLPGQMSIVAETFGGSTIVRVEEYKRPKFKVTLDLPSEGGKLGEKMVVKGNAMAFTGAAIDGAQVKYRVVREVVLPWWCWWRVVRAPTQEIAHGVATTDVQGKFEIPFVPTPNRAIPESDQPVFTFRISADITDSTGETRSGQQSIRLGYTALELSLNAGQWLEADQEFKLGVQSQTLDGKGVPANGTLQVYALKQPAKVSRKAFFENESPDAADYRRWETDKVVYETSFNTSVDGNAALAVKLPVGVYRAVASARDRFGKTVKTQVDMLVSDPAARKFSVRIPHSFVARSSSVEPGEIFQALWGTGYDNGQAYVEVEHRHKIIKSYWTPADATQHKIEVGVDETLRGGFTVHVTYFRENRAYVEKQQVYVPWTNKQMNLQFARFRDKLQPGQKETWSILVKGPGAEMRAVEMVAGLFDESLEAFVKHSWPGLSLFYQDSSDANTQFANLPKSLNNMYSNWNATYGGYSISYPQFPSDVIINFYGYDYFDDEMADGAIGGGRPRLMKSMAMPSAAPPSPQMAGAPMPERRKSEAKSLADSFDAPSESRAANEAAPATTAAATAPAQDQIDLSKVSARTNLNETAFFFPHLAVEKDGSVTISFTMPEALTSWKFMGMAHGLNGESGTLQGTTVTQKDLMVQPNPPRFLREGDSLGYTAKVTNMTDKPQKGKIRLSLRDAASDKPRDADFGLSAPELEFDIPAKESRSYSWMLKVPDGTGIIVHKVVASTGTLSDGEEAMLPILSKRLFVIESLPLPIRGPAVKEYKFQKLIDSAKSDSLKHHALTLQVTSNPAWYAVQALPYLMEFPHECSEQTFNRVYANSLARRIALADPKIKKVFETWKAMEAQGGTALKSNLEKNESLKNALLIETPWVLQARDETARKHRVGLLFDSNRVDNELKRGLNRLRQMQFSDGAFPWFPGGRPNSFITLYITTGFGRLRHLGVDIEMDLALKAVGHLDSWIRDVYNQIKKYGHLKEMNIGYDTALYLYGRSFFLKERPIPAASKEAVDYFLGQAEQYWLKLASRMSQAHVALGLQRFGRKEIPAKIVASMKERSVNDEELGLYWRDTEESWWWYRAPIETQALMIEVFDEVAKDAQAVEDAKVWLIKQKQTQDWKTSKATADAIYGLLLKGVDLLASDKLVRANLGGTDVQPPANVEAGTGYYEVKYSPAEIKPDMGKITLKKEDQGVAWGALHWQYFEDMSKVTPHTTNLKLKKTLWIKENTKKGPQIRPVEGKLKVGDLVTVRIELRTDRDMEYVHMKDGRGSGMEPTETLSQYRMQDGLYYYQATKDTASHFYIDYLPKGVYVFEYTLRVQHKGRYQTGMAEIQCMYAPEFNSHSESFVLEVE